MGERFCCFLAGVGAPVGECLDRHSPRKEGSRQAERCWGRDLADGLVSRQGMGVRAMGLRGGASKNNTPPTPDCLAPRHCWQRVQRLCPGFLPPLLGDKRVFV